MGCFPTYKLTTTHTLRAHMQESETTCRNRTQVSGFEQTSNQTVGHQDTVPTLYLLWPWNNERTNSNIKQTEATHPLATDANIRRREMNIIICKHQTYHREYRSTN